MLTSARTPTVVTIQGNRFLQILAMSYGVLWTAYAISPAYRPQWLLENLLVFVFVPILIVTHKRHPLSDLSYLMLTVFLGLHVVGAHYGYSDVPFGFSLKRFLGTTRNPYDRIVHASFGLLLSYPLYEILLRYSSVSRKWAYYLPVDFVLAFSGAYEIIEAATAWTLPKEQYSPFVGMQGDMWDAQRDMLLATAGAALTMALTAVSDWLSAPRAKRSPSRDGTVE